MAIDVLVVDEDTEVLEVTEAFLSRQDGLAVATETDPRRALERVTDGEFEAVVSDFSMPEMDGLELCRELREAGSSVPFMLFTGREERDVRDRETDCVTAFVRKGSGSEQYDALAEHIREAVD